MAKKTWNNPIDKSVDWGGDATTGNLPVSGAMIQKFIKDSLDEKAGLFYYDTSNNRYLVFADADTKDEYLLDPTKTELILGTFNAPFDYTAEITLISAAYNAVFLGSTGNYLNFTFDIKNKQNVSTGESVTVTYTFIRNSMKQEVKEIRRYGETVNFNIDKFLGEGTNTIIIGIAGQNTLAATTVSVTYQVVNLVLTDEMDISKVYDLTSGAQMLDVPFTLSGYGTKIVEWYLDGQKLDFVKSEDEVVDVTATRRKYITLSNLQQGKHSLQIRAYTIVNGENFYTDTLYRDVIVYTGANEDTIIGVAVTIPKKHGILGADTPVIIYDMVQYVPYTLTFATYSPVSFASVDVSISLDKQLKGTIGSTNGTVNHFSIVSSTSGSKQLTLSSGEVSYTITTNIADTTTNLREIIEGLAFDFSAIGKSNNSSDRDKWNFGSYIGTFTGFNWNNTSGWIDGALRMNAGASFGINYAPLLGSPTTTGKTIEIEWASRNVTNDDAIICDLRGEDGAGILITATKVSMISQEGVVVETEYKSEENVRVAFVINRSSGATNQRLSFIYSNGITSRGEKWAISDSYTSDKEILFKATDEAEVSLKAIRIYDVALTSDQILNNYTLYRDSITEMMEVYDRNDIYEEGTTTFSPDKMMSRLPVMIVTGDIPTLENTSDKNTQIIVDIDYYNMQDTSRSFRMTGAAMRPQGTSSMGYPKKNFRIYTKKVDGTILYDAQGNVVKDKLYSFKDKAQAVDCWCLKADYAESSGTHNVGIARLWNDALMNVQVNGEYVCRTGAQKAALEAGYPYDVRTAIDGFPILLFYRPTTNDDAIFIGKYNFNNDKSTESVFGFNGVPNFNNEKMQCWEVLNNGNDLALFTSVDGFDTGWSDAFESRYPDTKTPYTGDLKAFCQWMVSVSQTNFASEKWQHLNIYMMAAYWCYLMRHAAVDQFVKNAMFTSEDGQHFYYILYDNDTINGLINTGRLRVSPTDNRQTIDESGAYVFAGHESRLWNMLEADEEFKNIVSTIDNALYSAGISYANTIRAFDEEQADKWVEKVYNQDSQYKYVSPFVEKGIDNLFMLQGKRDLHRKWWLAKRFSIYDAEFVSGEYKSQAIELKCINGTPAGQEFAITSGYPLRYGFGINNVPRETGVYLEKGESHTFCVPESVNLGDPIRIYGAPNIEALDLSAMANRLAVINIANVYTDALSTRLKKLLIGGATINNVEVTDISGLRQAKKLTHLDIRGMKGIKSLDLSSHYYFEELNASKSELASVSFVHGAPVKKLVLPVTMKSLSLKELPYLSSSNLLFDSMVDLHTIEILSSPNLSNNFSWVKAWYLTKATEDSKCVLRMDNVNWEGVNAEDLINVAKIGTLDLKGKIVLLDISIDQYRALASVFGEGAFDKESPLFIDAPAATFFNGRTEILEGETEQYSVVVFGATTTRITWAIIAGSSSYVTLDDTGLLTVSDGYGSGTITIRTSIYTDNGARKVIDTNVNVKGRVYPTESTTTIEGNSRLEEEYETFRLAYQTTGVNAIMSYAWVLSGFENYAIIESTNQDSCVIKVLQTPLKSISGTLTCTLTRKRDNYTLFSVTKNLELINDKIAETDAAICKCFFDAGLCEDETFITKDEARYITVSDLKNVTGVQSNTDIVSFNGFQYFTSVKTLPANYFQDCTSLESIIFPSSLQSLGEECFKGCSSLTSINFSEGLETIGMYAFSGCSKLASIVIPESVTFISNGAFYNCRALTSVNIPDGVTRIGDNAFNNCTALTSVNIPDGVTEIAKYTFAYCSALTSVVIPEGVTKMGLNVFYRCSNLVSTNIPKGVTRIETSTFDGCNSLEAITIPEGVTYLGAYAFQQCRKLTSLTIPQSVTSIGMCAFNGCSSLTSLVIPEGVTEAQGQAFRWCDSLESVQLPSTVKSIGGYLFGSCRKLSSVVIPEGVENITGRCFQYCNALPSIVLPSTIQSITEYAFEGCTKLSSITCLGATAPSTVDASFGDTDGSYVGRQTYDTGENTLCVPSGATGYDTGAWLDPLCNATKCGFTLSATL